MNSSVLPLKIHWSIDKTYKNVHWREMHSKAAFCGNKLRSQHSIHDKPTSVHKELLTIKVRRNYTCMQTSQVYGLSSVSFPWRCTFSCFQQIFNPTPVIWRPLYLEAWFIKCGSRVFIRDIIRMCLEAASLSKMVPLGVVPISVKSVRPLEGASLISCMNKHK